MMTQKDNNLMEDSVKAIIGNKKTPTEIISYNDRNYLYFSL